MKKGINENATHKTLWRLEKFNAKDGREVDEKGLKPFETKEIEMNMLVNAGINEIWTLVAGTGGTQFDSSNAYLGVGDSSTAESATQTDLQAATNKLRKAMNSGYPTYGTSQKVTYQADFGSSEANFAWNEFGVFNASSGGDMMNRKVSSQGTKTSGQTWRLTLEITLS